VVARVRAWSSLAGIAFSVLAVVGAVFLYDGPMNSSPAKMTAWYSSDGNRTRVDIGWVLTGLALLCLIWFVAGVRERIAMAEHAEEPGSSFLSTLALVGGTAFVGAGVCQIGITAGIKTMSDDTYHHQVYSGLVHAAGDATYMMVVTGGAAMAAAIFAVSAAVFRYGILPRWVGWFGAAAGIAAVFSLLFFTMLFWMLWVAVASVSLFLRSRSAAAAHPAAAAA